jgi:integrative and conjugative element protein (TIGR02256 family)
MFFRRRRTVKVTSFELGTIHELAKRQHGAEIGGLLLGHWQDSGIIIDRAVEVTDPSATYSSWSRDEKRAQIALESSIKADSDNLRGYVGDWHTHPEMVRASSTDIGSLKRASKQYKEPIAMVIGLPDGSFDIHVAKNGRLCNVDFIS